MNFRTLWTLWTFKLSTHYPPTPILCNICENNSFSLIYADLKTQIYADILCDYLLGFISAISARTILSRWFTQILKRRFTLIFSANLCESIFCDICENDFFLTDLRRLSTDN